MIHETSIQDFDQRLNAFSTIVAQLKTKKNSPFDFQQNYKSANIAGEKLLSELTEQRKLYAEKKINVETFRINCGISIKTALQSDLAKSHIIRRALVSFLNLVVGLTIVIPTVTKITTGRWELFTNTVTESEKGIRNIANNLRGLREPGSDLPKQVPAR